MVFLSFDDFMHWRRAATEWRRFERRIMKRVAAQDMQSWEVLFFRDALSRNRLTPKQEMKLFEVLFQEYQDLLIGIKDSALEFINAPPSPPSPLNIEVLDPETTMSSDPGGSEYDDGDETETDEDVAAIVSPLRKRSRDYDDEEKDSGPPTIKRVRFDTKSSELSNTIA